MLPACPACDSCKVDSLVDEETSGPTFLADSFFDPASVALIPTPSSANCDAKTVDPPPAIDNALPTVHDGLRTRL